MTVVLRYSITVLPEGMLLLFLSLSGRDFNVMRAWLVTCMVCGWQVNYDGGPGNSSLRVAVLDVESSEPFSALSLEASMPLKMDSTRAEMRWAGVGEAALAAVAGRPVRFKFQWGGGGRLYSFWVSATACGASRGFLAAGGPGSTRGMDLDGVCV
eukprot:SAG22_NODE_1014_length_6027_cov_3.998988_2_plen_155_part_00